MSKKKQKPINNSPLNNLTNPAVLPTAIYFSVDLHSREHYFDFLERANDNILVARELLIDSKVIPKYFDIVAFDYIYDLKPLIAPLALEHIENGWKVIGRPDHINDEENTIEMEYGRFLFDTITHSNLSSQLADAKKKDSLPTLLKAFNTPEIVENKFLMSLKSDNDFELCAFDYQFPQKCVFAIPFIILGNKNPIEKFSAKASGIELNEDFQFCLEEVFEEESITVYDFDLLESAGAYDFDLIDGVFTKNIENAISEAKDTVVYYEDVPVFVGFNENREIDIRLPFLTFDMYAQYVLAVDEVPLVELNYSNFNDHRQMATTLLDELGLEYHYVLGQRIDFIHEPEMRNSVIAKVKSRDIIENNIYFEESDHDISGKESDATFASMAVVKTFDYPIFVLTMQNEEHIVKQVNGYVLNLESDMEEDIDLVTEYFSNMGKKNIQRVMLEEDFDMTYCEHHLKINGIFHNLTKI